MVAITEDFLVYVWQYRLFNMPILYTTDGQPIEILHSGNFNPADGPDFIDTRLKIGNLLWAGNVEIDCRSSDWNKHKHHIDAHFAHLILHVVYDDDKPITNANGQPLLTLALKDYIPEKLFNNYQYLQSTTSWIPCQQQLPPADTPVWWHWLDRLTVERLERKTAEMQLALAQSQYNWEEIAYRFIAKALGTPHNAYPFEQVAIKLPLAIIAKHRDQPLQVEALLFGQAGLLSPEFTDEYAQQCYREFQFLQQKYQLSPLPKHLWKTGGLRPASLPTLRLAHWAAILCQTQHLFDALTAATSIADVQRLFTAPISAYWHNHYVFDKPSVTRKKNIGEATLHTLIINTLVPLLFLYGKERDKPTYQDRAIQWLEELPTECNSLIEHWEKLGIKAQNAAQSQALIQLKHHYCEAKRCLNCAIGGFIMQKS